ENIIAVIAGTINGDIYYTHKGLTYGGWIIDRDSKVTDVIEYFNLLNKELGERGIKEVIYKKIPYIYSKYPSDEDEYVLFNRLTSKIESVSVSSTIDLEKELKFNKSRKSSISKSKRYNLVIDKNKNEKEFWKILEENLRRMHNASPVHSLDEILYLRNKFPENIKIFTVKKEDEVIAGVVVYITEEVVHIQYISANEQGKEISALDYLFNYLIKEKFKNKKYFDFGTSTENGGKVLNEGLIFQKEGFGGRGVNYIQYRYEVRERK
ncbi:MAG: GNAT family N-acetyltransferase, partial [Cetobacterium sp.]